MSMNDTVAIANYVTDYTNPHILKDRILYTKQDLVHPLTTPQALLSRHPDTTLQVCDRLENGIENWCSISAANVQELRYKAAVQMLETHGTSNDTGSSAQFGLHGTNTRTVLDMINDLDDSTAEGHDRDSIYCIPTGVHNLDNHLLTQPIQHANVSLNLIPNKSPTFLAGGIMFGMVTQVSGPPVCGKTQLCLQVVAQAATNVTHVWYLCTFAAQKSHVVRLQELISNTGTSINSLHKIDLVHILDEYQLLVELATIESAISNSRANDRYLVVIDSISDCLSTESTTMVQVMKSLSRLTFAKAAVLVANGSVRDAKFGHKPALGQVWKRFANIQLWLSSQHDAYSNTGETPFYSQGSSSSTTTAEHVVRVRLDKYPCKDCDQDGLDKKQKERLCTQFMITPSGLV